MCIGWTSLTWRLVSTMASHRHGIFTRHIRWVGSFCFPLSAISVFEVSCHQSLDCSLNWVAKTQHQTGALGLTLKRGGFNRIRPPCVGDWWPWAGRGCRLLYRRLPGAKVLYELKPCWWARGRPVKPRLSSEEHGRSLRRGGPRYLVLGSSEPTGGGVAAAGPEARRVPGPGLHHQPRGLRALRVGELQSLALHHQQHQQQSKTIRQSR